MAGWLAGCRSLGQLRTRGWRLVVPHRTGAGPLVGLKPREQRCPHLLARHAHARRRPPARASAARTQLPRYGSNARSSTLLHFSADGETFFDDGDSLGSGAGVWRLGRQGHADAGATGGPGAPTPPRGRND